MILYSYCIQDPLFTINEYPQSTHPRYGQIQDSVGRQAAVIGRTVALDGKSGNGKPRWTASRRQRQAPAQATGHGKSPAGAPPATARPHPGARAANASTTAK